MQMVTLSIRLLIRIAFENELQKLGIPLVASVILEEQSSMANGALGIKTLMQQDASIDSVFFANDDLAVGALFHCQSHGISVPQQIAIAGFNGLEMCQYILPRVTTISTPRYEMGRMAGEMIEKTISGGCISGHKVRQLDVELIVGETT